MKGLIRRVLAFSRLGVLAAIAFHPARASRPERRAHPTACSFCDRSRTEVPQLIAGRRGVAICDQCVRLCETILIEEGVTPL
jgi:ClpX C4-type zinc finger protein